MSRELRIGVDARELLGDTTGVGRYLGELMRRWCARPDAHRRRFLLYAPQPLTLPLPAGTAEPRIAGSGTGTWWEQTALRRAVRADRPDVFFAPAYTAPLAIGVPLAVTIHDVSFTAHPEWFRAREGLRRRWLTRRAAHRAAVILTVSEFSRREIQRYLKVPASRIQVIPNGLSGAARPRLVPPAARPPLVLYVGSLFNRRRVPDLIAAFAQATTDMPGARLAIVGADRTWPRQDLRAAARSHGVESRVDFREYVSDDELAGLYAQAGVFVFLSEYEGFGLTPLEAMAAGVPSVVLDTTVAREVYGDAVAYATPGDIAGAAAHIRRLLLTPSAADSLRASAPAVLARYSWDTAADRTLEQLERVAAR